MTGFENKFRDFLLFKPRHDFTYIRKLSMSYGYYTSLVVVDDSDHVTHVGLNNSFEIVEFGKLSDSDKDILGPDRCSSLNDDDLMSVYRVTKSLKLNKPYRLWKHCRGMRYTTPEETFELKRAIIESVRNHGGGVEVNKNITDYTGVYSEEVELDVDSINLDDNLSEVELPFFNSLNASGQTRLL